MLINFIKIKVDSPLTVQNLTIFAGYI